MPANTRTPFVGGNWKMNTSRESGIRLLAEVSARPRHPGVEVAVYPPFPYLAGVAANASGLIVGAQDCSAETEGAFTGQTSAAMIRDVGARSVLIGHSERRHGLGETDSILVRKVERAVEFGLIPVLCVGETLAEREAGAADAVILAQLHGSLAGLAEEKLGSLVVAYEPVWAIGTGRTASPEDAAAAHRTVRRTLGAMYSARFSESVRVIYGGSVNAKNAAELFQQEEIDGGLVGGASLKAADFLAIVEAAAARCQQ
jgi:triosephosphate isomerase